MSIRNWILLAVLFVIAIFAYDFLTKKPKKAPRWDDVTLQEEYGNWKEYEPQTKRFKVKLPALPLHTSASEAARFGSASEVVRYDIYLAQDASGTTYIISVMEYPKAVDIAKDDMLFDAVMNDVLASNPSSTLLRSEKGKFLNYPSYDFTVQTPDDVLKSRAVLVDNVLYVLTVKDKTVENLDTDFSMFTSSFMLQDRAQEAIKPTP